MKAPPLQQSISGRRLGLLRRFLDSNSEWLLELIVSSWDIDDLIAAAAAKAAESTLSADQKDMFRDAFNRFDLDGSGEIDASELFALTQELGLSRTEAELARLRGFDVASWKAKDHKVGGLGGWVWLRR